jgi:hypothetical protein
MRLNYLFNKVLNLLIQKSQMMKKLLNQVHLGLMVLLEVLVVSMALVEKTIEL